MPQAVQGGDDRGPSENLAATIASLGAAGEKI